MNQSSLTPPGWENNPQGTSRPLGWQEDLLPFPRFAQILTLSSNDSQKQLASPSSPRSLTGSGESFPSHSGRSNRRYSDPILEQHRTRLKARLELYGFSEKPIPSIIILY